MFIRDNIKLATRNFQTRKLRTFLTVLGISVGIGTTLFLVSLGYGLQKVLLEKIAKSDALLTLDVASPNVSVINIDKKMIEEISSIPGVSEVSPEQTILSQIKLDDVNSNVKLTSANGAFFRLSGIEFLSGEKYENDDDAKIVLTTGTLISLGIENFNDALGKEVEVTLIVPKEQQKESKDLMAENDTYLLERKFIISGIVDDPSESSGFLPSAWALSIAPDYYDSAKVKTSDQKNLENVRNAIVEKGFMVMALTDTVDQANKIFSIIQLMLGLFGIVALTVSAIGMFNTMTIALLERTNEIGIMKALGATRSEIQFLFLTESIVIGFLGGVGGIILSYIGSFLTNAGFNFLAQSLGGQYVNVFFTPFWFIVFIVIFSTFIGLITGIYPATRAARLNPLMALRYK